MKKKELARQLALETGVSRAEAADQVDRLVNHILHELRAGSSPSLPGFGQFRLDAHGKIKFREEPGCEKP